MKTSKNTTLAIVAALILSLSMSSCATLFGGKITERQKNRPAPGEPKRELRVGALVADFFIFWPSLILEFSNGAIYKPLNNGDGVKVATTVVVPAKK